MDILYRYAKLSDIDGMIHLLKQLFSIESDFTINEEAHAAGLNKMIGCSSCCTIIAEYNNGVIGMGSLQPRISTATGTVCGIIEDIIIDAGHRGHGIGTHILDILLDEAGKMQMQSVQLAADKNNTHALRFYYKNGWEKTNLIYLRKSPV